MSSFSWADFIVGNKNKTVVQDKNEQWTKTRMLLEALHLKPAAALTNDTVNCVSQGGRYQLATNHTQSQCCHHPGQLTSDVSVDKNLKEQSSECALVSIWPHWWIRLYRHGDVRLVFTGFPLKIQLMMFFFLQTMTLLSLHNSHCDQT